VDTVARHADDVVPIRVVRPHDEILEDPLVRVEDDPLALRQRSLAVRAKILQDPPGERRALLDFLKGDLGPLREVFDAVGFGNVPSPE